MEEYKKYLRIYLFIHLQTLLTYSNNKLTLFFAKETFLIEHRLLLIYTLLSAYTHEF